MTREEAIANIEYLEWALDLTDEHHKALDMAIEALKADVVSREEAIQAIDKCRERKNKEIEQLRELYSQKPTIPTFAESEEAYKAWTGEEMGGSRLIDADALKIKYAVFCIGANERGECKTTVCWNSRWLSEMLKGGDTK